MDLQTAMHRAVDTLEPPTERLVAGAIARGRRRRILRRAAEAGSAAVVLGAAAAIAVALLPGGTSAPARVGSQQAGDAASVAAKPALDPMSPQALLQLAIDSLPRPGSASHYAGNFGLGFVGAQFVYDDGHGAALIMVALANDGSFGAPCAPGSAGCTVYADGTRTKFSSYKEFSDARTPNTTNWDLTMFRTDGVAVDLHEFNAPQEKDAGVTRAEPPFTAAELTTWARNPKFSMQADPAFVNQTAHLFKPVNIDAPPTDTPLTRQQSESVEQRNCAVAKKIHKTPPPYC